MIILVFFVIIIAFLIWMIFVELSKFDAPINEANKEKERLKKESNELKEKWDSKSTIDDKNEKAKISYKNSIIRLYCHNFFKSFYSYVMGNTDKKIAPESLKVNYLYPCHTSRLSEGNSEMKNGFLIVLYIEYSYNEINKKDIHKTGYFEVVGGNSPIRISSISLDELTKYGIENGDFVKIESRKKQFKELFNDVTVEDIIAEWKEDSAKLISNSLQISSLDKSIKIQKNAKTVAIVGGLIAGAVACKEIDNVKKKISK